MLSTLMVGEGGEPGGEMEAGIGIEKVKGQEEDIAGEVGEEDVVDDMVGDGGESSWIESLREEEERNLLGGDG